MREIKFRAWDKKNNKWHTDWSLLFPWGTRPAAKEIIEIGIMPDYFDFVQFTGLKDKNGKEIYEGDIVTDGNHQDDHCLAGTHEVKFIDGAFFPFAVPGWEGTMETKTCEVIGNIYENPELLK